MVHIRLNLGSKIRGVVAGIAYLHSNSIVDGDVKAANVLVNPDVQPMLCDFGLSKVLDGFNATSTAMKGVGSIQWMAPELLNNEPKTTASDMFALGFTIGEVRHPLSLWTANSMSYRS
jgi:serine/threonine protein kinase